MEKTATAMGTLCVAFAFVFLGVCLGTLMGSLSGWVVGHVWPNTFRLWLKIAGWNVSPWQVGAMLGFVGGFIRPRLTKESKTKEARP